MLKVGIAFVSKQCLVKIVTEKLATFLEKILIKRGFVIATVCGPQLF